MSHAWLDSLSEDWVSQPGSDISQGQVPSFSTSQANSRQGSLREHNSRIPRRSSQGARNSQSVSHENSQNALSERSSNAINIQASQRIPSKLSQEVKFPQRGRHFSRSVSASTADSVLHNTVQHKSLSASPTKGRNSIPEWKRRLLYGDLTYGEAKDLFSSAGTGLENIFRPPPEAPEPPQREQYDDDGYTMNETTLPSSPPPYQRPRQKVYGAGGASEGYSRDFSEIRPTPRTREMKYTRNDETFGDSSRLDFSTVERSEHVRDTAIKSHSESSVTSISAKVPFDASRKISGKSDVHNEDFSPILISRHNNEDGGVSFAPIDLPAEQLRKRLDKLRRNQMLLDSEPNSQSEQESGGPGEYTQPGETTEDYGRHGGFLNLQRGGRSAEGSFRYRPLSPPLLNTDTSEMLPESSLQASTPKQFPTVRTDRFVSAETQDRPATPSSPAIPRAPNPSPEKRPLPHQSTAGSPLKLFGPYDTFTNQTLLRRISQFEDPMTESPSRSMDQSVDMPPQGSPSKSEFNKGFVAGSSPHKVHEASHGHHETFGAMNKFGAGELDGYAFNEDISLSSGDRSAFTDKENMAPEESLPQSNPIKFEISHHSLSSASEADSLRIRRLRYKHNTTTEPKRAVNSSASRSGVRPDNSPDNVLPGHSMLGTPKRDGSDGKRPRTSPSKDPTPKRRRTLHRSDIAYGMEQRPAALESVQTTHYEMQSAIGKKRKDARPGELQQAANPAIMAMRQTIRPRTPTPSQRSSVQRERHPLADLDLSADDVNAAAPLEGSEVFVQDFTIDGSRKTSIRTQDFLIEAERIMAMIRNKARPQTGLTSLEESDSEAADPRVSISPGEPEDSFQDSTKEPFSRPPSREGPPVSRMPTRQEDPELADRLRQYEEVSEMGDLITYSMRSMGLAKEAIQEVNKINESVQESIRFSEMRHSSSEDDGIISDLPNVRLSRNPDAPPSRTHVEFPSHGSHSSGNSTGRSVPTGSSRGSDSRRLIAPDVVNQLIGDQVGNMVLDKEKKIWMKVKTPKPSTRGLNILPSEDSEEDPFASIPDLSVDFNREEQNLGLKTAPLEDLEEYVKEDFPHPPSSGRKSFATEQSMDAKSILSHTKEALSKIKQTLVETVVEDEEEIEHEITIHEDRIQNSSPSRRRNLTITFSSPIASIIQDVMPRHADEDPSDEDASRIEQSIGDIAADSLGRGRHVQGDRLSNGQSNSSRSRSRSKGATRSLSMRGRAFIPRPVSRIDEQDEDTAVDDSVAGQRQVSVRGESSVVGPDEDGKRRTSVSFVITTPAPSRTFPPPRATPTIAQHVGTLSLSPLSEFTMSHGDQSNGLEISYVVGDNYLVTGDGSKKIMSQAIRTLVEKITEVEPFEPDWDDIQTLDINNKQLKSLHKLDEFCAGIVTLDASNNSISHLDGVPENVRNLKIAHNQLSELTAWGHLMNLQYVDISNNQINSLYAFKELVHLRSLRADNNQITSLEGIKLHDSLQVLRVRDNLIEDVDFNGTRLHRLTELDLRGNQISSVQHIEQLPCLSVLNLENNRLSTFATTTDEHMPSLKYLKLSNNGLRELDLAPFPSIRLLHADRNHLITLRGFARAKRLDSLSLREQKGDIVLDLSFLKSAYEVRKLFLSGNLLTKFEPKVDFLNLQYLELANCGLQSLSETFGQLMPNLRTLNLNFNAIEDLSALRYIPRLKKLLVAGNRLSDPTVVADMLAEFPHLNKLDIRDNPATLGFYPPMQALVAVEREMEFDPFLLPDASKERDETFTRRLDMGTKKRRRFYELVMAQRCGRLRVLDGLALNMQELRKKDSVWKELLDCGAVSEVASENYEQS